MKKHRPRRETLATAKSAAVKLSMARNTQRASATWIPTDVRLQSVLVVAVAFLLYANTLGHQWAQDDRSALCGKGKYMEEGKKDPLAVLKYLAEAVEVDGNDQEALWRLGVVQVKLGNYPQGIRCLSRLTEMRPDDAAAWEGLGWAYGLSGDHANEAECRAKAQRLKAR